MAKARQQYFADEASIAKDSREFAITPELLEKINSIEPWAQVNVIETVKVNWEALEPDDEKAVDVSVPLVEDTLYSTDTTAALSAKQWKVLYEYIQNISSRWRYLSNWNCVTWLAMTNPVDNPYNYMAWDYYVISVVAAQWGTNYRPNWSQYITWLASTTVETEIVKPWDYYTYDGTNWLLLINTAREIAVDSELSASSTNPVENRVVTWALNTKQNVITDLSTIRSGAAAWATALQPWDSLSQLTWDSDDITEGSTHLFMTTSERTKLSNQSWVNTWDETQTTIMSKLWAASSSTNWYLTVGDWNTFNGKQDAISDLSTIRDNATAGASAASTIATYWDIVTHDANEFASASSWALADTAVQPWDNVSVLTNDAWYVTDAYHDSTKQDTLVAGSNIQIASDWVTISATDTTYTDSDFDISLLSDSQWKRTEWSGKQDTIVAWNNIQIAADWVTISATDTTYTAWPGISISNNNVISSIDDSSVWWQITGNINDQTDLKNALDSKQWNLTAWSNIHLVWNTISADDTTYTAWTWISIDANNVISNTQTSAEWWNIQWDIEDQTDLQTALWWKQDTLTAWNNITIDSNTNTISADVNTKTFPMAVATKVVDAQAAIDWVLDWNNALIELDNRIYLLDKIDNWVYYFKAVAYSNNGTNDTMTVTNIEVTVVSDTVTEVHIMWEAHWYLETNRNYWTPFVPTQAWHPATKKYVDDSVSAATAWAVSDTAYDSSWDWVTWIAPSKNAVYDKINAMDTTISGKQETLIAWINIQIANDWKTISATDTTYTDSDFDISLLSDSQWKRAEWSGKQDAISDLSTIRSWASAWATAVQPNDNVSSLTNDAWYITKAVNDLTNYYTKTETYTKTEVDNKVANFAWFKVVATLPTTDIKTNIIYLLWPVGSWADKYEEYIYSNNTWIKIWETSVDLTNYFNTSTQTADNITEWNTHLFLTGTERNKLSNQSWTNTGDETKTTIQTKLGASSASNDWYLTSTDWSTFNWKQDELIAWTNIQIAADWKTISATDTTYTAWTNVSISSWNVISATDTTYTAWTWIDITNWVISNTQTSAEWWNITWTLADQTDLNTALSGKQDSLSTQTAYTSKGSATKVPQITTNSLWQVTGITEVTITQPDISGKADKTEVLTKTNTTSYTPSAEYHPATKKYVDDNIASATSWAVSDTAYASSWNWVTWIAPSKNAVYDKISAMDTTIAGKQATISDLSDIRAWASAWATAIQPNDNISLLNNNAWYITSSALPTKTSDLTNDSWFITNAVNNLTNYYTKSETYTKTEVDNKVANFAWFKVVATLPTTDIKTNIIYLLWPIWTLPDKYEEYIYSNNAWVKIWETSVDLTNYFNTSTQTSDNITQGSTNLFLTSAERTKLSNTSGTNTWDETTATIKTKLGAASASADWYLKKEDFATFNGKQDALATQTAYTSKGTASKVPQITTNTLGQVTWITEVSISYPSQVSDTAYASSWNWVTSTAPSKNAVYDKISAMDTTIWNKANTSDVVLKNSDATQLITATNSSVTVDTPLSLKSNTSTSYIALNGSSGFLWSYWVTSNKNPTFYNGSSHQLAYTTDIPTVNNGTLTITQNWTSKGTFTANQSWASTIALTDTTYESKTAASWGTAVSLVTTWEKYTWNNKQNALTSQTAYTSKGSATKVPQITTNTLGQVTGITEVTITQPDISWKLDKITTSGSYWRVYAISTSWEQVTVNITPSAVANTLVRRQSGSANITVPATPSADTDAASKKYVDDAVSQSSWWIQALPWSPIEIKYIWAWTQEQYDALSTYREDTIYHIV